MPLCLTYRRQNGVRVTLWHRPIGFNDRATRKNGRPLAAIAVNLGSNDPIMPDHVQTDAAPQTAIEKLSALAIAQCLRSESSRTPVSSSPDSTVGYSSPKVITSCWLTRREKWTGRKSCG